MKSANSYASLLRGVSQQVPQDRADGQMGEQVNMISDPVNGLTRRHGSVWQAEKEMTTLFPEQLAAYTSDITNYVSFDFNYNGKEYVVCTRRAARPVSANPLPFGIVYNKTDKVFLNYVRPVTDANLDSLESGGAAAIASVGKYLFLTGNTVNVAGTATPRWDVSANHSKAVIWIRGGAFSRKYTIKVRVQGGAVYTATYTTPSASYQGVLDTSGVPSTAPDYVKQVNDIVNAYNGNVTKWIGTSTAAIQPAAIATALGAAIAGSVPNTVVGSHICFDTADLVRAVEVDDGGDGTLIRGVADEIESADKTSVVHYIDKVVKVRSRASQEAYYLKAVPKDPSATGYTEVTWVEGAGVENAITGGFFYATIVGTNFYIASNDTLLGTITAGPHPAFVVSHAGDADTSPLPFFVNRKVTYLNTFQNRLLVGCGGVLAVSQTDDYLNFFRTTVLTLPASDPFEMLPQGSEDDNIRYSCRYDQDLVIFGKRRQYVISGTTALTPTSANMPVMTSFQNVADAAPVAAGGYVFFAKRGNVSSSVSQIQPGLAAKSPEAYPASSQLDDYIKGGVVEMFSATGSPSLLYLRTTASPNTLYTFAYLDKPDGRKMDAWNKWVFNSNLGVVLGMSVVVDGVQALSLRVSSAGKVYMVADFCPSITGLSKQPYFDSLRPYNQVAAGTGSVVLGSGNQWAAVFDSASGRPFTGTLLPTVAQLISDYPAETSLVVGSLQDAYVIPTNPFMRDPKGKAILSGRLTIGKIITAFKESTGFSWEIVYRGVVMEDNDFNGRILGDPSNMIGQEPVATGQYNIPIGRETRDYTLKISARRWYPLTITAFEWVGQFFNRTQRFGQ